MGFQFRPKLDALKQGAVFVHPRLAEAQGRVHMEMGVDERRRDEVAVGVEGFHCLGFDARLQIDDSLILDGDVDPVSSIGQVGVSDQEVEHRGYSLNVDCGCLAQGASQGVEIFQTPSSRTIGTTVPPWAPLKNNWASAG